MRMCEVHNGAIQDLIKKTFSGTFNSKTEDNEKWQPCPRLSKQEST
jgi:hypothetical protein